MTRGWEFWIDRGGTFTDVVARRPDGELQVLKLLSEDPERYADPAVAAISTLLGADAEGDIPAERVSVVRLGTTVATNALLERRGEPTVLVITAGFADALPIGYQNRPHIFGRRITRPEMLYARVIEADERVGADGEVIRPLDEEAIRAALRAAHRDGLRSVAIVCLHSYAYPAHEQRIAAIAAETGFAQVSTSHDVAPLVKLVSRAETTLADAYLSPVLARYVRRLAAELPGVRVQLMRSDGGLADAGQLRGKDAILSGPVGGVVGMARAAQAAGFDRVIGFDMGGTSTDVSHFAGEFERAYDTEIGGARIRAPMLAIHTVAAGGGSILHFDGSRFRVGPDSAGANPGPAAYRRGGPLTLTDANILLGRVQPGHFPAVFGPGGDQPLDAGLVRERFGALAAEVTRVTGRKVHPEKVAAGFLDIAVANMANAIKKISVQRGHDVTRYALSCSGGAGGQHACAVADALGMETVLIHPLAGVLSAYGLGLAELTAMRERAIEAPLGEELLPRLESAWAELEADALAELHESGASGGPRAVRVDRRAHLRYAGTDTALILPAGSVADLTGRFEQAYRRRFSFLMPGRPVVAEAVSVELTAESQAPPVGTPRAHTHLPASNRLHRGGEGGRASGQQAAGTAAPLYAAGAWADVPLVLRRSLAPGDALDGPAIVAEEFATTVVDPGWRAEVTGGGDLVLTRARPTIVPDTGKADMSRQRSTRVDPVRLELFGNLFMAVAEQMGVALQGSAHSVNIKERLDFSCALFDERGGLIANAPHMPVHLGSMGESIRIVAERNAGAMRPGDVYALNDPYHGGTHLPDITVVTPVFGAGDEILFYVASRGHHAEIGGITPGSMPSFSTRIEEEGVLIDNWLLVRDGRFAEAETLELLATAPYPSRNPQANLADLRAQIAATERGVAELRRMVAEHGLDVVRAYMGHVQDYAEESVRAAISALRPGEFRYVLDNGAVIAVAVRVNHAQRCAEIDFTGTSGQLPGNFNAPSSVAMAAVLYVFRTLVDAEIPLNSGCLKPIRVIIPPGSMLSPRYPAAVAAGNVETSQAITGALYGALGLQAEGSGTMNNVSLGNEQHQYYETVASGSGAGPGYAGTDVVQTHMTNSRLTDPEVLELRYPVRLERFEIRRGSGGAGRWPGGNGARRVLRFGAPMTVTLLSGHRRVAPYGMAGGSPGALGRQWVERADGSVTRMNGCDSVDVRPGDAFWLETPGGGGYGDPPPSSPD